VASDRASRRGGVARLRDRGVSGVGVPVGVKRALECVVLLNTAGQSHGRVNCSHARTCDTRASLRSVRRVARANIVGEVYGVLNK
jgi:hypothetical protein